MNDNIYIKGNLMEKSYMQCLFYLHNDIHCEVKKRAADKHVSMRHWITQAIIERIKKEQQYEQKPEE